MSLTKGTIFLFITILIILIWIFAGNPLENVRKKRELKRAKTLVEHIMDYSKTHNEPMRFGKRTKKAFDPNETGTDNSLPQGEGTQPSIDDTMPPVTPPKKGMNPRSNPADDYYPPTQRRRPGGGPQTSIQPLKLGKPRLELESGEQLSFNGIYVFTMQEDGTRKPLADGQYPILNGAVTMIVRGGKRILPD